MCLYSNLEKMLKSDIAEDRMAAKLISQYPGNACYLESELLCRLKGENKERFIALTNKFSNGKILKYWKDCYSYFIELE